jgi:uncharacterized repeat protein (TIGR02543 family)
MRKLKTILGILAALVVIVGISIPAAALACHLIVEPNNVTLYVGQHQQYTATYYDINNHPHNVTNDSNTTWTVTGGGTIGVHNGDFTATTPGTNFKVKATYNGYSSQVTVNVLALPTYTVTYNGNGSDSGTVPIDPSSPYTSGSSVTVLGNSGSLAKTGYTFNGWNTASDGSLHHTVRPVDRHYHHIYYCYAAQRHDTGGRNSAVYRHSTLFRWQFAGYNNYR